MIPYGIGTTANNIVSLESLGIDPPQASLPEYGRYIDIGDGTQKGIGWLTCEWRFPWVSLAGVANLRTYIAARSATVYIRTLDEDGTYSVYSAIGNWMDKQPPKVDDIEDLVITFNNMEAA